MRTLSFTLLLMASFLLGCGGGQTGVDPAPGTEDGQTPTADEVGASVDVAPVADVVSDDGEPVEGDEPTTDPPPAEPETETVKAAPGVAKQGRSLDDVDDVVTAPLVTPAKAYFNVREKAVFQIQIPSAMRMFEGTNGHPPKSHEEFMSQIIEAGQIKLPELPQGQQYEYDPEKGELMVKRPAN